MHRRGPFHIDPTVDCVIHTLLGDPRRSHILLDFLNAVVAPELRFESVTILNPVQNPEFIGDTQHVLDVEAVDQTGRIIQVEMQSHNAHALKARILYNWADLYDRQLKGGTHWSELRPVVCIWILGDNIFRDAPRVHHHFMVHDPGAGLTLGDHLHIHTLELPKWVRRLGPAPEPALLRWLRFFTEAEDWEDVPVELQSPILEEAMGILETFAENASWNSAYRRRMNWEVSQRTEQLARREAEAARDAAVQALEAEREAREAERQALEAERQAREEAESQRVAAEAQKMEAEAQRVAAEAREAAAEAREAAAEAREAATNRELAALQAELARLKGSA